MHQDTTHLNTGDCTSKFCSPHPSPQACGSALARAHSATQVLKLMYLLSQPLFPADFLLPLITSFFKSPYPPYLSYLWALSPPFFLPLAPLEIWSCFQYERQNKTIKMNKKIKKKGERKSNSHLIYYPGINSISVPGQRSSKKFWQSLGLSAYDLSHSEQWHPEWRSICLKINFIFLLLTAFIWYRMSLWTPNYSLTTAFLQPLCLWPWAQLPPWNAPPTTLCITHVSTHHLTRGSFICAMNAENKIHKIMKPTIQKYKITIFFKVWDTVWYLTHNKI